MCAAELPLGCVGCSGKKDFEVGAGRPRRWDRMEDKSLRTQVCSTEANRWPARTEASGAVGVGRGGAEPGGTRAHRPALFACHTSFGFIAFVQHPIVWFPFVPLSALLPFISQPAWLFSFLLSEVPERKVLFSAV